MAAFDFIFDESFMFQEKFEKLKEKRKLLSSETHAKADLPALSKDTSEYTKGEYILW